MGLVSCKKDPCKGVSCQNGGTCSDGNCNCSLPWEGSRCEVDARDKFVGSWSGPQDCAGPAGRVSPRIAKSPSDPRAILIDDKVARLVNSTAFTIPPQQVQLDSVSYTLRGEGQLNGNLLQMVFFFSNAEGEVVFTCTYILARQ